MSPQIELKIRRSFAAQSLMESLGARLETVNCGEITISAPIREGNLQQHGYAHAGVTFAIGDSAAGYAALSMMPDDHEVLTTEMKINLLAPGKGTQLVARGRVIKPGRRLVVVQADIYAVDDGQETHVALMTGTMMPMAPKT
ncbi:PaaI family thioesterase [Roseovarius faecimaris]|uniref:Medium/long-chain acyl-CoA thioesterase YigI n=1 Tax=Roseovarius faecimaris TaxID=2494550 RepID=A0A6I6IXZ1_9RHOB|nr:PaaI family thioesterase [Roseovarius faecimaris]QGX97528.1 PaaI family thioesterase [Roseovarius faecimaris]